MLIEKWFLLGILSYFSYSLSNVADKYLLNLGYGVRKTFMFKSLFNGLILLILGFLFFKINITTKLIFQAFIPAVLFSSAGLIFYYSLKKKDAQIYVPFTQSAELLFIFTASIIFLKEAVNIYNILGVILIILGIYLILLKKKMSIEFDRILFYMLFASVLVAIYSVFVKFLLFEIEPINLSVSIYFSVFIILLLTSLFIKEDKNKKVNFSFVKVGLTSFFGSIGTLLLFYALSIGNASKIYPLAGIQSVIVFFIAMIFLKEKFSWKRLFGSALVFAGIYFASLS